MSAAIDFDPQPESVGAARRFIAAQLADLPVDLRDVAQLCVSELATNSVIHAGTRFTVRITRSRTQLRVEVTDASTDPARLRRPRHTETHGRGLQIVSSLADEWGTRPADAVSGKTVWFALRTQPGPAR